MSTADLKALDSQRKYALHYNCIMIIIYKTFLSRYINFLKNDSDKRSQTTSDLYILNWKASYDVTLFMCQSRSTIFGGILICVIFRPRDMQEYIFMFSIALEWR
jgi:hypothetical protein